jgi:hypothetical protein
MTAKFKAWYTGISSLPEIELVCHVAHLNVMAIDEDKLINNSTYDGGSLASV